ncbi:MAG: hypothetical protein KDD01_26080 [Phaeodactylibacter sp.]|nr:hypothetical protein [Phaeodactylibacter sp.]
MTKEEKIDLVESYLEGGLTGVQQAMLEKLLAEDPSILIEIEEHKTLREALGPSDANAFRAVAREAIRSRSSARKKPSFFQQYRVLIASLAAALIIAVAWFFMPSSQIEEKLFTQYFKPPEASSIFRNADPSTSDPSVLIRKEIDSLYRRADYQPALTLLRDYGSRFPEVRSSDYYFSLGLMYLLNNQPEDALEALGLVKAGHLYDKPWYRGLAYLKAGNLQAARALFSTIAQLEGPYRKEAMEILEAMGEG